jgi:hypothetical protein
MDSTRLWRPERFFYSHATRDEQLTAIVKDVLESRHDGLEVYVAERGIVGKPLVEKLREELLSCNAILVGWTARASKKSSAIISFELGMAFSVGLPIFLLRVRNAKMPWFFDKLTDYADVSTPTKAKVEAGVAMIEPLSFYHPVDLVFPRCRRGASRNTQVVQEDGSIAVPIGFDGIVHFTVENRRHRPERNVRLTLGFPDGVDVRFDAGSRNGSSGVQRNEVFDMWQAPPGLVRLYWPSMPLETFAFELRLQVRSGQLPRRVNLECRVSSETLVGRRTRLIPFDIVDTAGAVPETRTL